MIGQTTINIYFGTKFDDFNVPYGTDMIRTTATKVLTRPAQYVWQTTWLSRVTIEVDDYQDIVGAQYVEIIDEGTANHGAHWHVVRGYTNIARKTVELAIEYDPLLSFNVAHITSISGVLRRWTVANDSKFTYTSSPEPIDQLAPFSFSYARVPASSGSAIPLVGVPYNLEKHPEVLQYTNEAGEQTQIYYPDLEPSGGSKLPGSTGFTSQLGGAYTWSDGMFYYNWNISDTVVQNYNYAVGLGMDLGVQAYMLPTSSLIGLNYIANGKLRSVTGGTATVDTNLSLVNGTTNNQKAREVATSFTLYNEISGEAVTVSNYQLNGTQVQVFVNPYIDGCFMARLASYMMDTSGTSGIVCSPTFSPFTISSTTNSGSAINKINNAMQIDSTMVSASNASRSAETSRSVARRSNAMSMVNPAVDFASGIATKNVGRASSGLFGLANGAVNDYNIVEQYNTTMANIEAQRDQQMRALSVQGTLGQIQPPEVKYASTQITSKNSFDFVVRKTAPSESDIARADMFFTMYGYNVNGTQLNNASQLNCRQRFTFVMADDVNIFGVSGGTNLTRLRDPMTIDAIRRRFSAGIRIWQVEPDYDFTKANPTK